MQNRTEVLFLCHGGGPLPLLDDPGHQDLVQQMAELRSQLSQPDAIVVISAHWEQSLPTVTAASAPGLLYDYYGFSPESYDIQYPCPGNPALAQQLQGALSKQGLPVELDAQRSLDHGVFVPLKMLFPGADIPVVQLSLVESLEPALHLRMGEALRALQCERLLVVGSGFSFHNMQAFFAPSTAQTDNLNRAFEAWLQETCCSVALTEPQRRQRLLEWASAPGARFCHPREEHLLPLHVCYGMAERPADRHWPVTVLGRRASMFYWQL